MARHPGIILKQEFMAALGLSASEVATGTGVNRSTIGRLLAGKQRLSPEMAARLGAYFQTPAKWWLQMQADYDADQIAGDPTMTDGVEPLALDPSVLLTPTGVLHLGDVVEDAGVGVTMSRTELERPPSSPASRTVQVVRYDSGSVALIGDAR